MREAPEDLAADLADISNRAKIVASDQNLAPVLELVQEIKEAGG